MTKTQQYFKKQMQNNDFANAYDNISGQVDIEWELERLKNQINNATDSGFSYCFLVNDLNIDFFHFHLKQDR